MGILARGGHSPTMYAVQGFTAMTYGSSKAFVPFPKPRMRIDSGGLINCVPRTKTFHKSIFAHRYGGNDSILSGEECKIAWSLGPLAQTSTTENRSTAGTAAPKLPGRRSGEMLP